MPTKNVDPDKINIDNVTQGTTLNLYYLRKNLKKENQDKQVIVEKEIRDMIIQQFGSSIY